ncbi:acyltransferase family protein [Bradyrhizobium guangdongense]
MAKLGSIQLLRALAAWAVVLGHIGSQATTILGKTDALGVFLYRATQSYVHAGVDLFFVISGFIIFIVTQTPRQTDRFRECADFTTKRALRIFPLFWITFFVTVLPQEAFHWWDWRTWWRQLTLIEPPINHGVAWTLVIELRFYFLVALLLILFRRGLSYGYAVLSVTILACCGFAFYGGLPSSSFTSLHLIEFVMGVVIAGLVSSKVLCFAKTAFLMGAVWMAMSVAFLFKSAVPDFAGPYLAGAHYAVDIQTFRVFGFGIPSALMVYGLVGLELRSAIRIPRVMVAAGDASYSVYLWNTVILTVFEIPFGATGIPGLFGFYAATIASVAAVGWVSYRCIERPLMRIAHRIPWDRLAAKSSLSICTRATPDEPAGPRCQ